MNLLACIGVLILICGSSLSISPHDSSALKALALDPRFTITSVSPLLIANDGVVTVSFSTTAPPSTLDWIGAFSPTNPSLVVTSVPVKYGKCKSSPGYMTTGVGSIAFGLTNLRANVAFYYFVGGTKNSTLVATSSQFVSFVNINQPLRNRIVPTGNPNVLSLLWSTANATAPMVKWGSSSGSYTHSSVGIISTVSQSSMCGSPANSSGWRDLGNINTAPISGIVTMNLGSSWIYYTFGDSLMNLWSPEFRFWVPPARGHFTAGRGTRVVLMADMGTGSSAQTSNSSELCGC